MRLGRLNITRIAVYWYTKRGTWSFTWRCRWTWKPEYFETDDNGGWNVWWGWWSAEHLTFDPYDDWGEEHFDIQCAILDDLCESIEADKP